MPKAYPLDWPQGRPRTKRRKPSRFQVGMKQARDELLEELAKMKATNIKSG